LPLLAGSTFRPSDLVFLERLVAIPAVR